MVKTPPFHGGNMGSNPVRVIFAGLAQLVEHRYRKPRVTGSTPAAGILMVAKLLFKKECGGDSKKDTPVPMSNTEVKLLSAKSSWGSPPARVGRCHAKYK